MGTALEGAIVRAGSVTEPAMSRLQCIALARIENLEHLSAVRRYRRGSSHHEPAYSGRFLQEKP
jgi:hypothetical protein